MRASRRNGKLCSPRGNTYIKIVDLVDDTQVCIMPPRYATPFESKGM